MKKFLTAVALFLPCLFIAGRAQAFENYVVNGTTYPFPDVDDSNWGQNVTDWAGAITGNVLYKAGGNFVLTSEAVFGSTWGLRVAYLASSSTLTSAATGFLRMTAGSSVCWRNSENTQDVCLVLGSSNSLTFNGVPLSTASKSDVISSILASTNTWTGQNIYKNMVKVSSTLWIESNNDNGQFLLSRGNVGMSFWTGASDPVMDFFGASNGLTMRVNGTQCLFLGAATGGLTQVGGVGALATEKFMVFNGNIAASDGGVKASTMVFTPQPATTPPVQAGAMSYLSAGPFSGFAGSDSISWRRFAFFESTNTWVAQNNFTKAVTIVSTSVKGYSSTFTASGFDATGGLVTASTVALSGGGVLMFSDGTTMRTAASGTGGGVANSTDSVILYRSGGPVFVATSPLVAVEGLSGKLSPCATFYFLSFQAYTMFPSSVAVTKFQIVKSTATGGAFPFTNWGPQIQTSTGTSGTPYPLQYGITVSTTLPFFPSESYALHIDSVPVSGDAPRTFGIVGRRWKDESACTP